MHWFTSQFVSNVKRAHINKYPRKPSEKQASEKCAIWIIFGNSSSRTKLLRFKDILLTLHSVHNKQVKTVDFDFCGVFIWNDNILKPRAIFCIYTRYPCKYQPIYTVYTWKLQWNSLSLSHSSSAFKLHCPCYGDDEQTMRCEWNRSTIVRVERHREAEHK